MFSLFIRSAFPSFFLPSSFTFLLNLMFFLIHFVFHHSSFFLHIFPAFTFLLTFFSLFIHVFFFCFSFPFVLRYLFHSILIHRHGLYFCLLHFLYSFLITFPSLMLQFTFMFFPYSCFLPFLPPLLPPFSPSFIHNHIVILGLLCPLFPSYFSPPFATPTHSVMPLLIFFTTVIYSCILSILI